MLVVADDLNLDISKRCSNDIGTGRFARPPRWCADAHHTTALRTWTTDRLGVCTRPDSDIDAGLVHKRVHAPDRYPPSFSLIRPWCISSLDRLVLTSSTFAEIRSKCSTNPLADVRFTPAQPAFGQSLRVPQALVMTLAPLMPVSQRQLNSRRTIQSECCFRKGQDHGVDGTEVRRNCAEL
jgi:hypothetical protein